MFDRRLKFGMPWIFPTFLTITKAMWTLKRQFIVWGFKLKIKTLSSGPNSSPLTLKIPAKMQRNSPSDFSATATSPLLSPQATLSSTIPTPATSSPTTEPTHSLQIPAIPSSPKSDNFLSKSFHNL
jgi:hypothetical protein